MRYLELINDRFRISSRARLRNTVRARWPAIVPPSAGLNVGAQPTLDIGQPGIIPPVVDVMAIE